MRLVGLKSAALCGCEGIAGQLDAATGRICVRLDEPAALVYPAGVKARLQPFITRRRALQLRCPRSQGSRSNTAPRMCVRARRSSQKT